jgi:hypothetical protein
VPLLSFSKPLGWKPLRFGNQVAAHIENTFHTGANCIDAQKVLELRENT